MSMKCEKKCILFGLGRWSKQAHHFRGGLGSLAEDCTGLRDHASQQGPTCLGTLAAFPREGQEEKRKKRNVFSVEFMACKDSPHWHLFAVTENTRKRMLRKEKSPLRGLKRTTAGTPRRSGRHQRCRAPGAGCSNMSMGTGRGEALH